MAFYHRKLRVLEKLSPEKQREDDPIGKPLCKPCDDGCPHVCNRFPPPPPSKDPIPTPLILTVCIVAAAFLLMICLAIQRYRSKRRNSRRLENEMFRDDFIDALHEPVIHPIWYIRTIGLPQSVIDSIEVFNYKKGEGLIEGSDCSVCLSEFEEDESLRLLPKCSHAFHVSCIDTWLRSHMNCPVCRAPIVNSNANPVNSMDHTSSSSSVSTEENQVENEVETEQTGEIRNSNETSSELPVEDEKMAGVLLKGNGSNSRLRVLSDLVDHRVKVDQELEPVRRSVSMDNSSASKIYQAVANIQGKNGEGSWKSTPFQGPVSMKRSVSSNGKCSLRKDSRVQDSIPI